MEAVIKNGQIVNIIVGHVDGSLPLEDIIPTVTDTQRISDFTYDIQSTKVVKVYTIVDIPQEELLNKAKEEMMKAVEDLIQSEITKYNDANMVAFKNIDACAKYTNIPTYTHYQFCIDVITWQTTVWETARKIQSDVLGGLRTMPTLDEFKEELPKYE